MKFVGKHAKLIGGLIGRLIGRLVRADAGTGRMMLTTFVILATFTAALVGGFLHATRTADDAIRANERRLLESQLEVTVRNLMRAQAVQLSRDDAMKNAGRQGAPVNIGWADTFLGEWLHNTVSAEEMFLVTPDGTLLRAWHEGKPARADTYRPVAAEVRRTLDGLRTNPSLNGKPASFRPLADTRWPVDATGSPINRWFGGIIDYRGQPALLTVISLVPDADELGHAVMEVFARPFSVFGQSVPVTASCGVSWAPEQAADAKTVLRNADIALFQAKALGRARYRRFTEEMDATIRWRRDLEGELRRAIASDHLSMVYQPIVNVADGSIASFEALVRWHHPERGDISPGTFVPVAEQAGLMTELGDWVVRRVFADSREFGTTEISINLSPLQLVARDFIATLKYQLAENKVDPSRFTFEITEGVLLDRSEQVMSLLSELQDMGFRLALDDFGTGYSSLAYLRTFQFDRIKIDRSFVQGIENDLDAQSILQAIVALGRTLRMKVVAEGVETLLQQQLVHAAGCQYIQGFLYWRAMAPDQVIKLLATDKVQSFRLAV